MKTKYYTVHTETIDGTLQDATSKHTRKSEAVRIIAALARIQGGDVSRYVVCDKDGMTVATCSRNEGLKFSSRKPSD